jgi:hypothetical protein
MDPDPAWDLDLTPDLTPFFSDFEDGKKIVLTFFSYNLPAGTLSSVLKIKFFAKKKILKASYQSAQHLYGKREGSGAGSGSIPLTNGSGSGRPKNMWIRWIRIRNTTRNHTTRSPNKNDIFQETKKTF